MSRGPTRRVRRMIERGEVPADLLLAARHEADLLGHPYIGAEHLQLARLRLAGDAAGRDRLRATLAGGLRRRWWQIRGPRSALRRAGRAETAAARRAAEAREQHDAGPGAAGV